MHHYIPGHSNSFIFRLWALKFMIVTLGAIKKLTI